MISLEFTINGREVQSNQISNELERAMLSSVADQLKSKLNRVRCPEHGQYARISAEGRSPDKLDFQVSGCCDELIEAVKAKL